MQTATKVGVDLEKSRLPDPSSVLEDIKAHLEGLKRTPDGMFLYRMIDRGLGRYKKSGGGIEEAFINYLCSLLATYANDPKTNPLTRARARLIQQRLAIYKPTREAIFRASTSPPQPPAADNGPSDDAPPAHAPVVEHGQVDAVAGPTTDPGAAEPSASRETETAETIAYEQKIDELEGVVERLKQRAAEVETTPELSVGTAPELSKAGMTDQAQATDNDTTPIDAHADAPTATVAEDQSPAETQRLEAAPTVGPVRPLDQHHDALAEKIGQTVRHNQEFDALLKSSLKALHLAESADDLRDLKQLLIRGMEDLIKGHELIGNNLGATNAYLKATQLDRQHLLEQLDKYNKHSLTDELTGLPKRESLIRQLQAEVGRAKRCGFSVALALIDIDNLKAINEKYGRDAGDEVLSYYARELMSQFRDYDVVARYGGDEFAVMFPNTHKEGAQQALENTRRRAADIVISHSGQNIPLPGFSSVLTIYAQGEKPEALLKRADEALDMAKLRGKGRITISLPTQ